MKSYKTVYEGAEGEIVEKKSRFIASVAKAETEEEAVAFIEQIRKKYWDARHHCSAFCVGLSQEVVRCSDDGEPSGTAGKPMLEVIQGQSIRNIVVVVTRYFGGTLLGTGGLVRAYTKATQEGIANSQIIEMRSGVRMDLRTDYTDVGKVQYILASQDVLTEGTDYTDEVVVHILLPIEQKEYLQNELTEGTSGRIQISEGDTIQYALLENGEVYEE
ncbi:MAG: YigZ family protein [Lachnospiraceae bacterium]